MVVRGAGGALFQWFVEWLVVPCSYGWQRGWWCPVPMVARMAGGALFLWLVKCCWCPVPMVGSWAGGAHALPMVGRGVGGALFQ
jgi:hypothetical protein